MARKMLLFIGVLVIVSLMIGIEVYMPKETANGVATQTRTQSTSNVPPNVFGAAGKVVLDKVNGTSWNISNYHWQKDTDGKLYTIIRAAPPEKSAKYSPKFNESIELPEWFKEKLKEAAKNSSTYFEAVVKVRLLYQEYIHSGKNEELDNFTISHMEENNLFLIMKNDTAINYVIDMIFGKNYSIDSLTASIVFVQSLRYIGIKAKYVCGIYDYVSDGNHQIPEWVMYVYYYKKREKPEIYSTIDIEYYDPAAGWIIMDPMIGDSSTTILPGFVPFMEEDYPIIITTSKPVTIPVYHFEVAKLGIIGIKYLGDKKIIFPENTGLVVTDGKDAHYIPANTIAIIPSDWNFDLEVFVQKEYMPIKIKIENGKIKVDKNIPVVVYS